MTQTPSPLPAIIHTMTSPHGNIFVLSPARRLRATRGHPPLVPPGHHDYFEVAICYEGEMNIVADAALHVLRKGDAMLIMPGAWHYESYRTRRQPYKLCWVIEQPQQLGCNYTVYARGQFAVRLLGSVPMLEQHALLTKLAREARERPPHWEIKIRSLLTDLLVEFDRRLRAVPASAKIHEVDPVWRLLRIVETRFREPLQLKLLAREVGLSEDYLSRRFRATYRTTFKNYLHTIRIHHAQLLLKSGWSVKQTAAECGFSDEYYFNKVFKQMTGTTPGKFRRGSSAH